MVSTAKWRQANREYLRDYQRKYRAEHPAETRAYQLRYRKEHPQQYTMHCIRHFEKTAAKLDPKLRRHRCRVWMFWALKAGLIKRPKKCSLCGRRGKIQAHHPDYTRPLEVVWACRPCHHITFHAHQPRRPSRRENRDWMLVHMQIKYLHKIGWNQIRISRLLRISNSTACKHIHGAQPHMNKRDPELRQAEFDLWAAEVK